MLIEERDDIIEIVKSKERMEKYDGMILKYPLPKMVSHNMKMYLVGEYVNFISLRNHPLYESFFSDKVKAKINAFVDKLIEERSKPMEI